MKNIIFVSVLLVLTGISEEQRVDTVKINTPQGKVYGIVQDTGIGEIDTFLGLPFAKAPLGELRLKPPVSAPTFKNYNATYYRPNCIQRATDLPAELAHMAEYQSEDCLYLNVFKPSRMSKRPVMVWIHGGAYTSGAGAIYVPRDLVAVGKVIVVTINYRLGMLGFFPGGGVESTLGLRDQIMALKWVQENIESYGGDPDEVTIFGESAGGQSVSFLTLSPKAKGLFKRAIIQSGVALSNWFPKLDGNYRRQAIVNKGRELGCSSWDPIECARQIPIEKWAQLVSGDAIPFYHPDVDNEVIMEDYATNLDRLHPGLDLVMGLNTNDGGLGIYYICSALMSKACNVFSGVTQEELFSTVNFPEKDEYQKKILVKTYAAWYSFVAPEGKINLMAAAELATDIMYRIPTNKSATNAYRNGNNVYVYEFNSRLVTPFLPWRSPWTDDADHGEELGFLFGWLNSTDHNYEVSVNMISMWTGIAKGEFPYHWPKFTSAHGEYLLIDDENPGGSPRQPLVSRDKDKFWQHYKETGTFPEWWITSGAPSCYQSLMWTALLGLLIHFWY